MEVQEPTQITTKTGRKLLKQDCTLGDVEWYCGDQISGSWKQMSATRLRITVRFYQDLKYLALGHSTTISKINDIGNVSTDNSNLEMSSSSTEGYIDVVYADEYKCCISCKAKVHPITDVVGECTKCSMKVKLSRCETTASARVKFEVKVIQRKSLYLAKLYEQLLMAL